MGFGPAFFAEVSFWDSSIAKRLPHKPLKAQSFLPHKALLLLP
jgi:hypothetical protein